MNVKSAFQTSLNFKKNKIEIRVFCKTKRNKKTNSIWKQVRKNQRKINPKTKKTNLYNQVENMKRKEEQKQDFFLGLFSSRASRKKMPI